MTQEPSVSNQAAATGHRVNHDGVRIHYEVHGAGPPVLLHHGFAGSIESWRRLGYIDALKTRFRVIAMDARGHGRSDKPHDEADHTMILRAADVAAVLDETGVERVHYWGYSMGARTGFAFLQMYGHRVASFVNGAAGPGSPKRFEEEPLRRRAALLDEGDIGEIGKALHVPPNLTAALLEGNDLKALAASTLGLLSWDGMDPKTIHVPSFHYAGENDPLLPVTKRAAEAMAGAEFRMLAGLNHLSAFARSADVLPLVTAFLEKHAHRA